MPKVTIYTQVYNAGAYLKPCIEGVLSQTEPDWQWILVDSCSTDGSPAMIDAYAEQDPRIIPIHMPENRLGVKPKFVRQYGTGKYFTTLDHDDWWEPEFLERLYRFAEENELDYAITGVVEYYEGKRTSKILRQFPEQIVLTMKEFAEYYPAVGPFAGAYWGSLLLLKNYLAIEKDPKIQEIISSKIVWRSDTLVMLRYVGTCRRIGIDNTALYHYRRHLGSQVQLYTDKFFVSNLFFYESLRDFFEEHNTLNHTTQKYLKARYLFEMCSTLNALGDSDLSADEKMEALGTITTHPLTEDALSFDCEEREQWWKKVLEIVYHAFHSGQLSNPDTPRLLMGRFIPDCAGMLSETGLEFLAREPDLLPKLASDDWRALAERLLKLMAENQYVRQFDLAALLRDVLPEGSPLGQITDARFFRKYHEETSCVLREEYVAALDKMTERLLNEKKLYAPETFLQLYLTLAALENQVSAFLFGKVRLAEAYYQEKRLDECRALLDELEEMGAGDLEEAERLRQLIEEKI